jgi:hypothetical protein
MPSHACNPASADGLGLEVTPYLRAARNDQLIVEHDEKALISARGPRDSSDALFRQMGLAVGATV